MSESSADELLTSAVQVSSARLRRQHELAVEFAMSAHQTRDIAQVLKLACEVVADGVHAQYVKVLQYQPADDRLLLVNGVGWGDDEVGIATLSADDASPAGHAYICGRPVLSNHLGDEHRFRTPDLLLRHGIKRAINVPIRGVPESFGVLEADSSNGEDFIEADIVFMESIANVISMTIQRVGAERYERRNELLSESVLNASTDCIKVLTPDGHVEFMNANGMQQMGIEDFAEVQGKSWRDVWPIDDPSKVEHAIRRALNGESERFEAYSPTRRGEARWWDVSVAPIKGDAGDIERIVAVSRDITERHTNEQILADLISVQETKLDTSELMMKEVHHRVSNSLQLVQTLLALQGNLAGDKTVASHLQVAATRVLTVASVHQRLYEGNQEATNASAYLSGLVTDLRALASDRSIAFKAPSEVTVPAEKLAPLGLVTAELVTNAIKYGKGDIAVTLAAAGKDVKVTVEDEGPGFPDAFPTPQGTGLGMRLIKAYAGRGPNAIMVDRNAPFSRIVVTFKVA